MDGATVTITLPVKPPAIPVRCRLGEIRILTRRQGEALTALYAGCIGMPFNNAVLQKPEQAIRLALDRIADQLGLP